MELLWYQSRSKASFELPENKSKEDPNSFTNSSKLNPDYENIVDFPNKNKRCGNKDVPQYQLTMVVHWMSGIPASQPCISPYLSHLFPDTPALKATQSEYEYELRIDLDFPPQHQNIFTMDILVTPKNRLSLTEDIQEWQLYY